MAIKYAAIIPCSPLLVSSIGKQELNMLSHTKEAVEKIKKKIKDKKIDRVMIISAHGSDATESAQINLSTEYEINFESFGDFSVKKRVKGDILLSHLSKQNIKKSRLINKPKLNHGIGIPLHLLTEEIDPIRAVPVYAIPNSLVDNFANGEGLREAISKSDKNTAVIASANLSYKVGKGSPHGYSPKGKKFDQTLIYQLKNKKNEELINTEIDLIKEVEGSGVKAIAMLAGVISKERYEPHSLSYETDNGIGHLTMEFNML